VPLRRLGLLLGDVRAQRGTSIAELASQSFFTPEDLAAIEGGERDLTDHEVLEVLDAYAVDVADLLPERTHLVIDLADHVVAVGDEQRSLAGRAPTPDKVLASYLSLVYTLRRTPPGTPIVLRDADLDVLARALDLAKPAVTSQLHRLMAEPTSEVQRRSRSLRGRVLVPIAGVVVAATAVGALVMVQSDDGQTVVTEPSAWSLEPAFVMTNADGSTTPVYIGDGIDVSQLPPGAVALANPTQGYPGGTVVVNADGQAVPGELPPGEVWIGDAQVAVRNPDGSVTQGPREP
jgi:hypothetical protein